MMTMFAFNSIRFKISVLFVLILGCILIVHNTVLHETLKHELILSLDRRIEGKANELMALFNVLAFNPVTGEEELPDIASGIFSPEMIQTSGQRDGQFEKSLLEVIRAYDLHKDWIVLADEKGEAIAKTSNVGAKALKQYRELALQTLPDKKIFRSVTAGGKRIRVLSMVYYSPNRDKYMLQVGARLEPVLGLIQKRFLFKMVMIPIVLVLTSFFGLFLANRILNPVMKVSETARRITQEDLSTRVRVDHPDKEIEHLISSFNEMIERLEKAFRHISDFSSHVAHELKTPLAVIRGEAEIALHQEQSAEEYGRVLRSILDEAKHMIYLIESLLFSTRLEYQENLLSFGPIDFTEFLQVIYEQSKIIGEPKKMKIQLDLPDETIRLKGDEVHLRRLFLNLIDNALKFSPEEKSIHIEARKHRGNVEVSIADQGEGIAGDILPRIFDKFYHLDRKKPGAGLGLHIAKTIAELHGGTIQVSSTLGRGTVFTVTLPCA